jgi:hypothetical protein
MVNLDNLFSRKGQFISATFKTETKPAAIHKGTILEKRTSGVFRAGLSFENLSSVKEAIENGERDEVGSLPFGEWEIYPFTILHTPKGETNKVRYVRLYPTKNASQRIKVLYLVNGTEVTKEQYLNYLTPSEKEKALQGNPRECFNVKHKNILALGEPFNEE